MTRSNSNGSFVKFCRLDGDERTVHFIASAAKLDIMRRHIAKKFAYPIKNSVLVLVGQKRPRNRNLNVLSETGSDLSKVFEKILPKDIIPIGHTYLKHNFHIAQLLFFWFNRIISYTSLFVNRELTCYLFNYVSLVRRLCSLCYGGRSILCRETYSKF